MISAKHLANAIYKLSKEGFLAEKISSALFWYLEKYRLLPLLPATLKHLAYLEKAEKKFTLLKITSGLPIDDETADEIRKKLSVEETADLEKNTDKELIGGFVATHKGFIYDASLKRQLNLLKAKLTEY